MGGRAGEGRHLNMVCMSSRSVVPALPAAGLLCCSWGLCIPSYLPPAWSIRRPGGGERNKGRGGFNAQQPFASEARWPVTINQTGGGGGGGGLRGSSGQANGESKGNDVIHDEIMSCVRQKACERLQKEHKGSYLPPGSRLGCLTYLLLLATVWVALLQCPCLGGRLPPGHRH